MGCSATYNDEDDEDDDVDNDREIEKDPGVWAHADTGDDAT